MTVLGKNAFDNPALLLQTGPEDVKLLAQLQLSNGGTFTLNGVTAVTVANKFVTANSLILTTLKTVHGTVGAVPAVKTITPGTGFTVAGTAADLSDYNYAIVESA